MVLVMCRLAGFPLTIFKESHKAHNAGSRMALIEVSWARNSLNALGWRRSHLDSGGSWVGLPD